MPKNAPTLGETLLNRQQAFLLHQLVTAPYGTLPQSPANKAISKQIKKELNLAAKPANDLRKGLVEGGCLTEVKVQRVVTYSITEEGKRRLSELERYLPLLPTKGEPRPPADDQIRLAREVYLLSALARAPKHSISKADLEVGFGGKGKPKMAELVAKHPHLAIFRGQSCLELNPATTRAVLTELALRGHVSIRHTTGSESYSLTPAGIELLGRLRSECPILPPTGKPTPAPNEAVRQGRQAFVLLKLLQSSKYTLWESDAATGSYPKPLKLNHATGWKVRRELARDGQIVVQWDGKEGCYLLTQSGKEYLATLPFDSLGQVKIKGYALTELLATAREIAKPAAGKVVTREEPQMAHLALSDAHLETAVMDIFYELLRGQYGTLRMVPIHEIRKQVAERFGADAVSHAVFNDVLLGLRRAKKVRLISIDDRSRATPEQLQDSVFAVGETFFYVENAHASA